MKKVLLACLLLAFLFCAACGQQKEETAVPMPADGGDEAQIRLDPNDPLNSYLDLSQLDQATLAACTQTLDITSENNGVTATLRSVVGDAMTLYLTVDLTFPDPVDLSAPPVSDASSPFYGGATFDFTMETPPESDPLENTPDGIGQQGIQLSENTVRYMLSITYRQPVLTPGKEVTLSLSNPYGETSTHLFHWTVETQAPAQEATLTDQEGTMVGTGFFSPFSACVTLQKGDTLDPDALLESTALLDASGQPIPGFQLSGVEGDPPLFLQFLSYVPVLPDQLHTLQTGSCTAQIHWTDSAS